LDCMAARSPISPRTLRGAVLASNFLARVKRSAGLARRNGMPETPTAKLLAETRLALHQVAEHVLSPAVHAVAGHFDLRQRPGGFSTPPFEDGPTVIAVEGVDVIRYDDGGDTRAPLTTIREIADALGVEPGFPASLYRSATPYEPDRSLPVDAQAAGVLADWYALGQEALTRLAAAVRSDDPSEPRLWPEHFDLAIVAREVNYGFSPGDDHSNDPYVYVGPFGGPPTSDDFWNAPFGAMRTIHEIGSVEDAVAFLHEGRRHARESRRQARRTS